MDLGIGREVFVNVKFANCPFEGPVGGIGTGFPSSLFFVGS